MVIKISNPDSYQNPFGLPVYQCGNFIAYKIANTWNKLPADAVNSNTVNEFKTKLDKIIHTL